MEQMSFEQAVRADLRRWGADAADLADVPMVELVERWRAQHARHALKVA